MICQIIDKKTLTKQEIDILVKLGTIDTQEPVAIVAKYGDCVAYYNKKAISQNLDLSHFRRFTDDKGAPLYDSVKFTLYDQRDFALRLGVDELPEEFFANFRKLVRTMTIVWGAKSNKVRTLLRDNSEIRRLLDLERPGKGRMMLSSVGRVEFVYHRACEKQIKIWFVAGFSHTFDVKWSKEENVWNSQTKKYEVGWRNNTFVVETGALLTEKEKELVEAYRERFSAIRSFVVSYACNTSHKTSISSYLVGNIRREVLYEGWTFSLLRRYRVMNVDVGSKFVPGTTYEWFAFCGPNKTYKQQTDKLALLTHLPDVHTFSEFAVNTGIDRKQLTHSLEMDGLRQIARPLNASWVDSPVNHARRYFHGNVVALVEFVLVLGSLQLPIYIYEELLMWLNRSGYRSDAIFLFHRTRIITIQSTLDSIRRIWQQRESAKRIQK